MGDPEKKEEKPDLRLEFIWNQLMKTMRLKQEKWNKLMGTEECRVSFSCSINCNSNGHNYMTTASSVHRILLNYSMVS